MQKSINPIIVTNARNMFAFTLGQKVIWSNGKYDYYFIQKGFKDNGIKFYDIKNPLGVLTTRVREDEMIAYN